jgi:hypothetical protein
MIFSSHILKATNNGDSKTQIMIVLGENYYPQTDCRSLHGLANVHLALVP